jgi:Mg2+/Co2+ transporter CorB
MSMVWIAAACLLATMFFSAAEMAFIAANRLRLRHLAEEGSRTAARYLEDFRRPERVLSTAMMGVTIAHIVASSAATYALLPVLGGWAPWVVTAALTPVMLVFGEIIPRPSRASGRRTSSSACTARSAGPPRSWCRSCGPPTTSCRRCCASWVAPAPTRGSSCRARN